MATIRWVLVLGAVVLALFVAGRHFHWQWADLSAYFHHGSVTVVDGDGHQAGPENALTPEQAAQAAGRRATVCGKPANVYYARTSNGAPTFVDFGASHPDEDFTIVIFGRDRNRFNPPPESWSGHRLCVSGLVKYYEDRPEIIAYAPDQIRLSPN